MHCSEYSGIMNYTLRSFLSTFNMFQWWMSAANAVFK